MKIRACAMAIVAVVMIGIGIWAEKASAQPFVPDYDGTNYTWKTAPQAGLAVTNAPALTPTNLIVLNQAIIPTAVVGVVNSTDVVARASIKIGANGVLMSNVFSATSSLFFGTVAANSDTNLNIAVTGCKIGDSIAPGWPIDLKTTSSGGTVHLNYYMIPSNGLVTVRCVNVGIATINTTTQTFRATVFSF